MANDQSNSAHWDVLATELRTYREQQRQTWGDLDNALIGRYLAGEVDPRERATVEVAFETHPELKNLAELVRDVLGDFELSLPQAPITVEPERSRPRVFSFTDHRDKRTPFLSRIRPQLALALAACLILALGVVLSGNVPRPSREEGAERKVALNKDDKRFAGGTFKLASPKPHGREVNGHTVRSFQPSPPRPMARGAGALLRDGKLDRAEDVFFSNWSRRRNQFGLESPKTQEAIEQVALLSEAVVAGAPYQEMNPYRLGANPYVPETAVSPGDAKALRERERLRDRVVKRAIPVLLQGVDTRMPRATRIRCSRALARLGPAARKAVPQLADNLKCTECPIEKEAVLTALRNIGPPAAEAVPAVERVAKSARHKELQTFACEVLQAIDRPAWVGMKDKADVYSAAACAQVNERLIRLSHNRHFHFVAETIPALPERDRDAYRKADSGSRRDVLQAVAQRRQTAAGANRGVYVLICQDPPAVEVAVAAEAKARGFTPENAETVRKILLSRLDAKKNADEGLNRAVELVIEQLSK